MFSSLRAVYNKNYGVRANSWRLKKTINTASFVLKKSISKKKGN